MLYSLLADLVTLTHLAFVVFVVLGGFLAVRWPSATWLHLPAAGWGAFVELAGRTCPLTPLENRLRQLGGEAGFSGGFIEHYLVPVLYPHDLGRELQIWLGALVVLINVLVYFWLWRRRQRRRSQRR